MLINFACDEEQALLNTQEQLINKTEWNAVKFIVNGENTMPPENSDILDNPVTYLQIKFIDQTNMFIEMELGDDSGSKDNSGVLPMTWSINSDYSQISIVDNNTWTEAASFTGDHEITLSGDTLRLKGKLGEMADYELELIGQ